MIFKHRCVNPLFPNFLQYGVPIDDCGAQETTPKTAGYQSGPPFPNSEVPLKKPQIPTHPLPLPYLPTRLACLGGRDCHSLRDSHRLQARRQNRNDGDTRTIIGRRLTRDVRRRACPVRGRHYCWFTWRGSRLVGLGSGTTCHSSLFARRSSGGDGRGGIRDGDIDRGLRRCMHGCSCAVCFRS